MRRHPAKTGNRPPASRTALSLCRLERIIYRLKERRAALMHDERRKDAHEKIALGGLVVKAGLRAADRAFILGALIQAAKLNSEDPQWRELRQLGIAAMRDVTKSDAEAEAT
ncbi:conjugal transfer protein TraD [Xanthobacter sp. V13C-7B]|uniref:conjugal transfer protein TraD n=1 Tax=Xanthobacter variabilis TaxID=3119932 RepID=UPI00372C89AC